MMLRFSKKAVRALFKFQNTQIMTTFFVMPICPHRRQYPGSVWAVKKYCFEFGIGTNLATIVTVVWLDKRLFDKMSVGCGSAKLVLASKWFAERKLATKPWQTQKIARGMMIRFFQEKRLTYVSTFQISKRTKNAWAWGLMFLFSKKIVCST